MVGLERCCFFPLRFDQEGDDRGPPGMEPEGEMEARAGGMGGRMREGGSYMIEVWFLPFTFCQMELLLLFFVILVCLSRLTGSRYVRLSTT